MSAQPEAVSLEQFTSRVLQALAADPLLREQWVVAETVEVRLSGGHCYLELIEKDPSGKTLARARATIWASHYYRLAAKFQGATGQPFGSGMKVMVRVTAAYHQVFGLSLNITDIDPSYTMGSLMRARLAILSRLKDEGIIDLNRSLPWPAVVNRIAVISAPGAAGYGDFIKTLYTNPYLLRFTTRLFPAVMQGERTAPTVISALEAIYREADRWDCVVIIRGGGSTADLVSFDDYDLAANIAQFPIPVISGIGHERDTTVPDYVANMRVITPTDAAKWLIERGASALAAVQQLASEIARQASERIAGCQRQLAEFSSTLPLAALSAVARAKHKADAAALALSGIASGKIAPALADIHAKSQLLRAAVFALTASQAKMLDARATLIDALSPQAVLRRGFTLTCASDGTILTSASQAAHAEEITTTFADGTIRSIITTK